MVSLLFYKISVMIKALKNDANTIQIVYIFDAKMAGTGQNSCKKRAVLKELILYYPIEFESSAS